MAIVTLSHIVDPLLSVMLISASCEKFWGFEFYLRLVFESGASCRLKSSCEYSDE